MALFKVLVSRDIFQLFVTKGNFLKQNSFATDLLYLPQENVKSE